MSRPSTGLDRAGATTLTVANFALVFIGLLAIAFLGETRFDRGLVNVWSIWGIAHVSLGQSLQVMAAMGGHDRAIRRLVLVVAVLIFAGAALIVLLRARLFDSLSAWWVVAAVTAFAAAAITGMLRGLLVRDGNATVALAIVCGENALRVTLLLLALGLGVADSLLPFAVVAPFALSIPVLVRLSSQSGEGSRTATSASWGRATLTMIPALASYALVPALSVMDRLPQDVDALAIDAALARGPVQVAVFLAPKFLEILINPSLASRRVGLVTPAVVVALIAASLAASMFDGSSNLMGRWLVVALVGITGLIGYLALLESVDRDGRASVVGVAAAFASVLLFAISISLGDHRGGLAPVAWAAVGAVAVVAIAEKVSVQ